MMTPAGRTSELSVDARGECKTCGKIERERRPLSNLVLCHVTPAAPNAWGDVFRQRRVVDVVLGRGQKSAALNRGPFKRYAPCGLQASVGAVRWQVAHEVVQIARLDAAWQRRALGLEKELARALVDSKAAKDACVCATRNGARRRPVGRVSAVACVLGRSVAAICQSPFWRDDL